MSTASRWLRRTMASARNAMELIRLGRLAPAYGAAHEVVDVGPHHRLRRYPCDAGDGAPVVLLVPPLMITSEVYDIEPELSAVTRLGRAGIIPYVVDFGAPERADGGMTRTLDDHVLAVVRCIQRTRAWHGRDVHLAGYSQGGMFAYQAAAFVRSEGVATVITFGSPVDIHRNLPAVHSDAVGAIVRVADPVVSRVISRIEGLPGVVTSTAFKLVSGRKEIEQAFEFLRSLHDRRALERREARRRFLAGDGFVAWPGPAFREFVDQFVVHNRMLSGGFVLDGRTVTLADITSPILAFVGAHDEMASPSAVRAITRAAPEARVSFYDIPAGHFGIVVGSRAMAETWPAVAQWIHHHEGRGALPEALREPDAKSVDEELPVTVTLDLVVDAVTSTAHALWQGLGDVAANATDLYDGVRYQEPRLRRLATMTADTVVSPAKALSERAARDPQGTFFLWRARAFTWRDADARVSHVVRGLYMCGVRAGDRVGVVMGSRPSFLTMVTALSRLGAVAVLAPPDASPDALRDAFARADVTRVATDPDLTKLASDAGVATVLVLGGGGGPRDLGQAVVDMESIDPATVSLPDDLALDAGRAQDLAMILLRPSASGELRAAPVTNHRWALSALGAAAACTLQPSDTVYCCIPLHHPAGVIVSVGAALMGGARLALAERFDVARFWPEVRRYGATVVFYAGEMLRPLVHSPPGRGDRTHPLRLFAGSGMRADLSRRLHERFGAGVMEFYASTTQRVIMANASGEKPGALGRRLPGSVDTAVVRVDLATGTPVRDGRGRLVRVEVGEAGLLVARLDGEDPMTSDEVLRDAFVTGDRWHATNDVVRVDHAGDHWYVDARGGFAPAGEGFVSLRRIEDALYAIASAELAVAWRAGDAVHAAVASKVPVTRQAVVDALAALPARERPARVAVVDALPVTEGFRPNREGARARADGATVVYAIGEDDTARVEPAAPTAL